MLRRIAVNKYYRKLHGVMRSRYGLSDSYTPGQIIRTIEQCGFSKRYIPYALALFMEKSDFLKLLESEFLEYNGMAVRGYLSKRFFDKNSEFEYKPNSASFVGNSGHTSIPNTSMGVDSR